ncbi:hypothetical protein ETI06_09970 [Macrococcoides goetzii]|nr:hypothetical protein [Macrococcus goetzii]TDM39376.1 hypothetical protein ETI10_11260 [Macrococcus goetzii]TDM44250.1 hypothetical protein ETI08_10825 [Macrococcus goetzii]TDM47246.1 hypothetical protein ETI06_09970 [Macrococcus goetzii]
MKIYNFSIVGGHYVTTIKGQQQFGFGHSGDGDFSDIKEIIDREGYYKGMTIRFYNLETGEVYEPFQLNQNVTYGDVIFHDGLFYFLQADFNEKVVRLISFYPEKVKKVITNLSMIDIQLNKLMLIGDSVNIVHHGDMFISYYPEQFEIDIDVDDTVVMIDENKVYINQWIEEEEILEDGQMHYNWYNKLLIKDFAGKLLSEEIGMLQQHNDGSWWLS